MGRATSQMMYRDVKEKVGTEVAFDNKDKTEDRVRMDQREDLEELQKDQYLHYHLDETVVQPLRPQKIVGCETKTRQRVMRIHGQVVVGASFRECWTLSVILHD